MKPEHVVDLSVAAAKVPEGKCNISAVIALIKDSLRHAEGNKRQAAYELFKKLAIAEIPTHELSEEALTASFKQVEAGVKKTAKKLVFRKHMRGNRPK